MRVNTVEDEIIREIAEEKKLPYKHVRDIVFNGQSGFTRSVISSGSFNSVRWPGFGTFKVKPKYAMVSEHMKGLAPVFREIFKQRILNGSVFENKWKKIKR